MFQENKLLSFFSSKYSYIKNFIIENTISRQEDKMVSPISHTMGKESSLQI